jgi:CubicO group peptidase (beta-lactamase class C family)
VKKALRITGILILSLLVIVNLLILVSGKTYIYKTLIYTYVGIDDLELFHHRSVATATPQPWPLSEQYNKVSLPDSLNAYLERMETVAFVIIKDDSLFFEKYWNNYSDSSLTNSFSMAKSIVSVLTGFALQEGKIKSLDQRVSDFIPEYKDGRRSVLTIRHLLQMSAGLRWDEAYASLFSVTTESYYGTDLHALLMKEEVVKEPGKEFNYQSGATQLLAFVLEAATGKNLSTYASEKLWQPLGAEHPAEWSLDHKDGKEKAYCCFYSNARDFARIGSLFLNNGKWKGKQLLDSSWVRQSVTPTHLPDFATGSPDSSYGYMWWIGPDYYYCRGILGQYIIVLPESKTVIVRLGHNREKLADGTLADVPRYVKYVREMISERGEASLLPEKKVVVNLQ